MLPMPTLQIDEPAAHQPRLLDTPDPGLPPQRWSIPAAARHRPVPYRRAQPRPRQTMMLAFGDRQSADLEAMIRFMWLDDALVQRPWRLEYLYLDVGFTHYRLFHRGQVVGIRDVTSVELLPQIQRGMAALLAQLGVHAHIAQIIPCGARTPLDAKKHRLPTLFLLRGEARKGRKADGQDEVCSLF